MCGKQLVRSRTVFYWKREKFSVSFKMTSACEKNNHRKCLFNLKEIKEVYMRGYVGRKDRDMT